jgi:hypothetical protein
MGNGVFTADSLRVLIRNCRIAFRVKNITNVSNGYGTPPQWEQNMLHRVDNEPIARLFFICIMRCTENGVTLADVLNADPEMWNDCIQEGDIIPYNMLYGDISNHSPNNPTQN